MTGLATAVTGATASITGCNALGQLDRVRLVNDQGGISGGITVKQIWQDTALNVAREMIAFKKFVESGAIVASHMSESSFMHFLDTAERDELPIVSATKFSTSLRTEPLQWAVVAGPGWGVEFATFINWALGNWTESRPMRVGILGSESPSTHEVVDAAPVLADDLGFEFVGYEIVPMVGAIDLSTELIRLDNKNVDWIYTVLWGATLVTGINDIAGLGLMDDGVQFCQAQHGINDNVIGITGGDIEGWYCMYVHPLPSELDYSDPKLAGILETAGKYQNWDRDQIIADYVEGHFTQMYILKAIEVAIEEVGFDNLTGGAVRDALTSMTFDCAGTLPPATITNEQPFWQPFDRVYEVQNGQLIGITDWIEPSYYLD